MLVLSRHAGQRCRRRYRDSAPNAICAYIYELAGAANKFYHDVKIISEPDEAKQASYVGADGPDAPACWRRASTCSASPRPERM